MVVQVVQVVPPWCHRGATVVVVVQVVVVVRVLVVVVQVVVESAAPGCLALLHLPPRRPSCPRD